MAFPTVRKLRHIQQLVIGDNDVTLPADEQEDSDSDSDGKYGPIPKIV